MLATGLHHAAPLPLRASTRLLPGRALTHAIFSGPIAEKTARSQPVFSVTARAFIRWEECGTVVPPSSDSAAIAAAGGEGVCYLPQVEIIPLRACLADLEHSG